MKPLGNIYKTAEVSGDFKRLPAGGYIAEIKAVEDKTDKSYLNITFDIAEGEFRGFYADEWGKEHPYAHAFVRSYKQTGDAEKDKKIMGMFKGFLRTIDRDNGTTFEAQAETGLNEGALVGKRIGLVLGYEEYNSDRGEIRERLRVSKTLSVDDIKSGNYKVPDVKRLAPMGAPVVSATYSTAVPQGFESIAPEDIPF